MNAPREIPSRLVFRDPLQILLAKESRTCKGCAHEYSLTVWGTPVTVCTDKDDRGRRRNHGRRCKAYENPTEKGNK